MMREEYIKMKNSNKWDTNWFYKYFLSKGGNLPPQEFSMLFQQFADLNSIINYLDVEFGIVSLHAPFESGSNNKIGKFIKVIE